ncbi:hypothetical protein NPIL_347481 [Nephila pilipes]|uniref:Uncharacterized protein n=1 Tax=Nephila pilipes TaxID=299642 RepID=A0A8X6TK23_NEPPI|nr:hypothetical protein NPIL_347481 [Nephila pilipes]
MNQLGSGVEVMNTKWIHGYACLIKHPSSYGVMKRAIGMKHSENSVAVLVKKKGCSIENCRKGGYGKKQIKSSFFLGKIMMYKGVRTQAMTQHHKLRSSVSAHPSLDEEGTEESSVCSAAC